MLGEIRQEILSGLREIDRFVGFRTFLRFFPGRLIQTSVFENAAAIFNLLRSKGIQSSNTDCLICACALEWNVAILTKDQDFILYQKHLPIRLYASS